MRLAPLALAVVVWAASASRAGDVPPEAKAYLDEVAKAYTRRWRPTRMRGRSSSITGPTPSLAKPGAISGRREARLPRRDAAVERPSKIAIDGGIVKMVSDGKILRTTLPPLPDVSRRRRHPSG